jgi:hypothetical protein
MAEIPGSLEVSAIPENMSRKLVGPKAIDPDCVCVVFFLKAVVRGDPSQHLPWLDTELECNMISKPRSRDRVHRCMLEG